MPWYVLDENNIPVPADEVRAWPFHSAGMIVGFTEIRKRHPKISVVFDVVVSTTFLGLDMNTTSPRKGPAILFQTTICGGPEDGKIKRYSTWDDAKIGHNAAVRRVHKLFAIIEAKYAKEK